MRERETSFLSTQRTPTPSQLVGQTFAGKFFLYALLGEGAMGTVYAATQRGDARRVAVKVMRPHLMSQPTLVARFLREARAASEIRHPNAVQVIDHGFEDGLAYLVMELVEGRDLFTVLTEEGRLSQARAARVLMEVCAALAAVHAQSVVHRDLKPENVMLLREPDEAGAERVKLLDFGIAKRIATANADERLGESASDLTAVGTAIGTPAYMSPEQCRGVPLDARADIYSCGVLLYQLVTGRVPFDSPNPVVVCRGHLLQPPRPPSELVPGLHPQLENIMLRALCKYPDERPQSAAELRAELAEVLPQLPERGAAREPPVLVWAHQTTETGIRPAPMTLR